MGTLKILDWCQEFDCPQPEWKEQAGSVYVIFKPAEWFEQQRATGQVTTQVTPQVQRVILACKQPLTRVELQNELKLGDREHFRKASLLPALAAGVVERTIPDKPQSRLQRYRLTETGRAWLTTQTESKKQP